MADRIVSITLTVRVETPDEARLEVVTFKPQPSRPANEVLELVANFAAELQGQHRLPLDAGDADPAFVS
jgi:hypothetical protein